MPEKFLYPLRPGADTTGVNAASNARKNSAIFLIFSSPFPKKYYISFIL